MTDRIGAEPPAHRWRAYWICVGIAVITIMDLSKINVGLPAIERALHAGSTELQVIISGFVLTFGLALVPFGRLGDQRSRKALFVLGLSVYTASSLLAALAPDAEILMLARLIQGVGAGIQMPQVLGMIQELFQGKERGKAFGLFGAAIGLGTAFGPTLGGLMIGIGGEVDGWRGIFWMNIPLGVLAIIATVLYLPDIHRERIKNSLDPVGVVLFGLTVLALLFPFLLTTGSPDDDPRRWWLLVVFVVAAAVFVWWESRYQATGKQPLIPLGLFRIRSFRNGTLVAAAYFAAGPPLFVVTSLFLQDGLGIAPVYAGMVSIGFALASAVTSWWSGLLVNTYGRTLITAGLVTMLVSAGAFVLAAETLPDPVVPWALAAIMTIAGAGGGLVIAPNQTLTLSQVPLREGGLAGSVGQLGQRVGTAIGSAIALSLFYATIIQSGEPDSTTYHHAYALAMIAVGIFLALALLAAVADSLGRSGVVAAASE